MPNKSLDFNNPPRTAMGSVINTLCHEAHDIAVEHGFYEEQVDLEEYLASKDEPDKHAAVMMNFTLAQLAKIASEVGEAVGAIQHGEYLQLHEELADVVIRVFDLADYLDFRLGDCVMLKMEKNRKRPWKHGKLC